MENKILKIQSISDIITNSSTEVFMVYDNDSIKNIKELVNAVLSINKDNKYTFDDLFTIKPTIRKEDFLYVTLLRLFSLFSISSFFNL